MPDFHTHLDTHISVSYLDKLLCLRYVKSIGVVFILSEPGLLFTLLYTEEMGQGDVILVITANNVVGDMCNTSIRSASIAYKDQSRESGKRNETQRAGLRIIRAATSTAPCETERTAGRSVAAAVWVSTPSVCTPRPLLTL